MKSSRILVTGGAGYIGSYVCRALLQAGQQVVVLDDFSTGQQGNLPAGVKVYTGDFTDSNLWNEILVENKLDIVIHLAAKIDATESISKPGLYLTENATKVRELLNLLEQSGIDRVIFSSSAAVYGDNAEVPTSETALLAPLNPYGQSKQQAEEFLKQYSQTGHSAVVLRYFNVCGSLPEVGIHPVNQTSLLAAIRIAAHNPKQPFLLFGKDYPTPDGTCQRDLVHVADIAQAHLAIIEQWQALTNFEVINIGTGQPHSVWEVLEKSSEVFGLVIPYRIVPRRPDEIVVSVADNRKMRELLGLELHYSDLESILKTSL